MVLANATPGIFTQPEGVILLLTDLSFSEIYFGRALTVKEIKIILGKDQGWFFGSCVGDSNLFCTGCHFIILSITTESG